MGLLLPVPLILRQAMRLLRPLVRAVNWVPVAPAGALALLVVWLIARDDLAGLEERMVAVRIAAVLLALSIAFVLDDVTAELSASTPSPLLLRRAVRVLIMVLPTAVAWTGVLWVMAKTPLTEPSSLPVALLTVELAAIVMLTIALAAVTIRWGSSSLGGASASGALLGLTLASWMTVRSSLWVYPGEANWVSAHLWWGGIFAASLVLFVWASLEPARQVRRPREPSTPQPDEHGDRVKLWVELSSR